MENEVIFFPILIVLLIIIIKRKAISNYLFEYMDINISSRTILDISLVLLAILMILGVLLDNTKEKYSSISAGYNKMRPNLPGTEGNKKPHRWFDIDFDSIFPWK